MTKEEAVRITYKRGIEYHKNYRNPTMVSWDRVMRAMDLYAESQVNKISSNTALHATSKPNITNTKKLIKELFVGKVAEIIGMEKTLELLKEATDAIEGAAKSKQSDVGGSLPSIEELQGFLYWTFHKADRVWVEHTLGWRGDEAIKEIYTAYNTYREGQSKVNLPTVNLAKRHIYLTFAIQDRGGRQVGEAAILIHKERDIEKWKNPDLVNQEAIDNFKQTYPEYEDTVLSAFYRGDIIPSLPLK